MTSSVEIMACCLLSAKPLSEAMLTYCQLDIWEHILLNVLYQTVFIQDNKFENVVGKMGPFYRFLCVNEVGRWHKLVANGRQRISYRKLCYKWLEILWTAQFLNVHSSVFQIAQSNANNMYTHFLISIWLTFWYFRYFSTSRIDNELAK